MRRLGDLLSVWAAGLVGGAAAALCSGSEQFYRDVAMPAVHRTLEPETAHRLALRLAASRLLLPAPAAAPSLATEAFGRRFEHPVGIAAGFDKDAEAVDGLLRLGFSFVEVGSVTPQPQPGNERPRIFRLPLDGAVINRCGFNSSGHRQVLRNLQATGWHAARQQGTEAAGCVGVNLGANKSSADAAGDYALGAAAFGSAADYLVLNVSSPNTPGLRRLQRRSELRRLLAEVKSALPSPAPALLLKISPDCSDQELRDICELAARPESGVSGLVVTNTTVARPPGLASASRSEVGGLSGRPLRDLSNETLAKVYGYTGGRLPIVGVGGVSSGADALEKLELGASLLQVYTVLVFDGFPALARINSELADCLKAAGYSCVGEAVGAWHRRQQQQQQQKQSSS